MSKFEKKFAICLLAFGAFFGVAGYVTAPTEPYGYLILLACLLYVAYMYFTREGDDT
jgi:hypothetical protein